MHSLVALDYSPRRLKLTKPLLGFHASFDPGLFAASVPVVDVLEFRKVDYFEVVTKNNGEGEQDEEKRDARLEIDQDTQQLRIVDEKNGASKATYVEPLSWFFTTWGPILRRGLLMVWTDGSINRYSRSQL